MYSTDMSKHPKERETRSFDKNDTKNAELASKRHSNVNNEPEMANLTLLIWLILANLRAI